MHGADGSGTLRWRCRRHAGLASVIGCRPGARPTIARVPGGQATLILYNVAFVVPLNLLFVLVYFGTTSKQPTDWIRRRAAAVKLGMATFFAVLATWMLATMA